MVPMEDSVIDLLVTVVSSAQLKSCAATKRTREELWHARAERAGRRTDGGDRVYGVWESHGWMDGCPWLGGMQIGSSKHELSLWLLHMIGDSMPPASCLRWVSVHWLVQPIQGNKKMLWSTEYSMHYHGHGGMGHCKHAD